MFLISLILIGGYLLFINNDVFWTSTHWPLISIMMANHEVGSLQPIRAIAELAKQNGVCFHTDACQAIGAININVKEIGVDIVLNEEGKLIGLEPNILLREKYFDRKSLIFENFNSRSVILRHKGGERALRVDFPDFPYLLLWHFVGADYMCIEPWNGLPDVEGSGYEISEKFAVRCVKKGEYMGIKSWFETRKEEQILRRLQLNMLLFMIQLVELQLILLKALL